MNDKHLLAIGHDRNRSDSCITVWDVEKGLAKDSTQFMGLTETCHSLCWEKSSRILIAGMSQKNIKIFDLRRKFYRLLSFKPIFHIKNFNKLQKKKYNFLIENTTCTSITTRTVHGLSIASNGYYLCSYVDSRIGLWDLRNIEKPLTPLMTHSSVLDISWCPTRSSLLSSIDTDSIYLNITDVAPVEYENDREVFNLRRSFIPFNNTESKLPTGKPLLVYDIAWHPEDFEQALVLSENGIIVDFILPPTVAISWSNTNDLAKFCDLDFCFSHVQSPSQQSFSDDIAGIIKKRSQNNYGLLSDIKRNGELADCPELKKLWNILANLNREEKMVGLKSILGIGTNVAIDMFANNSEAFQIPWPEFFNNPLPLTYYKSEGRKQARKMCGWNFEEDMEDDSRFILQLKSNHEYSRAAMICVFHMKIFEACEILSKAADDSVDPSMYRIAAIALSGFNTKSTVWKSHRWYANKQIKDVHLRVMFFFLTVENQNYDGILYEQGICLADRIAFACRYLNDTKLGDYVKHCIANSIEVGDLTGLILTGENSEGIRILQSYIDKNDDVQTPCLIAIRFFRSEVFQDKIVQSWIESYLELLDSWGLWENRAELEIRMESLRSKKTINEKTVHLLCNFCGKSVSTAMQEEARLRNTSSNAVKVCMLYLHLFHIISFVFNSLQHVHIAENLFQDALYVFYTWEHRQEKVVANQSLFQNGFLGVRLVDTEDTRIILCNGLVSTRNVPNLRAIVNVSALTVQYLLKVATFKLLIFLLY